MMKEAIEDCGSEKDADCLGQYLSTLKDWRGAGGPYTFDKNGDAETSLVLYSFDENGNEVFEPL